jgi:hypothetical protein
MDKNCLILTSNKSIFNEFPIRKISSVSRRMKWKHHATSVTDGLEGSNSRSERFLTRGTKKLDRILGETHRVG